MSVDKKRANEDNVDVGDGAAKLAKIDAGEGLEEELFDLFGGGDGSYEKAASFKDMALGVYEMTQVKIVEHKTNGTQYIGFLVDLAGSMPIDKPVWLQSSITSKMSYTRVKLLNEKAKCDVFTYVCNRVVKPGSGGKQFDVVFVKKPSE